LVGIWTFKSAKLNKTSVLYQVRFFPLAAVLVQVLLGVLALLNSMNDMMLTYSILHQFGGIVLMSIMVFTYFYSRGGKVRG
jgi:cytochrome c oxidase assembly protein subunit 15